MTFPYEEATVVGLATALRKGNLTSAALVEAYLARIEEVDASLGSVLEVAPDAQAQAAALDEEREAGHVRGPLHGLPLLVKDNVGMTGPLRTTAGSLALLEARPARDATVVERLRAAGAIVLGTSNLSEWANFRSTHSTSGWSARGGQCRNPYALDRNPCGSSSGSGAAVAANLCVAAVGTETDGSIVCPSSVNGVVGIKPTLGLVSRAGIVPIAHSQDTAGPMARTVADATALLVALAGSDPLDDATGPAPAGWDPLGGLAADDLRGLTVGVARNLAGFHPGVDACFEHALEALAGLGATLVDPTDVPHADDLGDPELEVLLYEFRHDLEAYLATLDGDCPRTLEALIAFNEAHAQDELVHFGQEHFIQAAEKGPLTEPAYLEALSTCRRLAREEGLDAAFATSGADVLVAPTAGPAWTIDHVNGDHPSWGNSGPAAIAGYPAISVPMGFVSGLPVGLTFMGPAWSEQALVRCAAGFERATGHRRPPALPASVG
ncbi:MAG: amidase [Planctomycetaceae bacterium]